MTGTSPHSKLIFLHCSLFVLFALFALFAGSFWRGLGVTVQRCTFVNAPLPCWTKVKTTVVHGGGGVVEVVMAAFTAKKRY